MCVSVCVCVCVCVCNYLKAVHVEEDVGVVLRVDRHKGVLPLDGGERAVFVCVCVCVCECV